MNNKRKNIIRVIFGILAVLWMIGIFCFSSRDSISSTEDSHGVAYIIGQIVYRDFEDWDETRQHEYVESIDHAVRKTAHATEYAFLFMLLYGAIQRYGLAYLVAVLYACSDEYHQSFVPGRSGNVKDALIDSAGALTALCIVYIISRVIGKRD